MRRHTLAATLAAMAAVHAEAQTRVDLRTQTRSVDFSGAVSTKPSQTGAVLPATCTLGQTFLNTSAQPGQNLYICTAANVWSVQGANGLANYATSFIAATSVTVPGITHQLGTAKLFVEVYDTSVPAVLVEPDGVQINPTTYDVSVKFATPQSGTVVLSAAGGGVSSVASVFGRLGTITAQTGDYNAAQVTNAAQTNGNNAFTAGTQDFSGAAHTLPAKVGMAANIPATCSIGEMYFASDATAGQNWYYCTAVNTWTPQVAGGGGLATISLDGTIEGSFSGLNLVTPVGINWQLVPSGQTLNITPQIDNAVVPSKVAANTYGGGNKQTFAPSTTTAGLNVSSGTLPSVPVVGDLATDPSGNLNWYDGTGWRLGTVADTVLTSNAPIIGNGTNHVATGNVTGSGSFVLETAPTISNPLITSFINSPHDHSSPANGGPIAEPINVQSGAGYTLVSGDQGKLVTVANATPQTVNLPATTPGSGWFVELGNIGPAAWTISANGKNIDGSGNTVPLISGNGIRIVSDGTNYYTQRGMGGATVNQNIRQVILSFDGGGVALSGTITRCQTVEFGGTIQRVNIVGDLAGNGRFKVLTVPFASYAGPSSASDISNGGELISGAFSLQDSTLTGWNTALAAGTVVCGQLSNGATDTWWAMTLQVAAN